MSQRQQRDFLVSFYMFVTLSAKEEKKSLIFKKKCSSLFLLCPKNKTIPKIHAALIVR